MVVMVWTKSPSIKSIQGQYTKSRALFPKHWIGTHFCGSPNFFLSFFLVFRFFLINFLTFSEKNTKKGLFFYELEAKFKDFSVIS